ncbi:hypothetical protein VTI74DRAFT_6987 [Chaetomium olivicolor]
MNDASGEIHEHVPRPPENEWAHLVPSRWWFASSAFPMIAGTLGPVASAFSICALVKPWRQSFPPETDLQLASFISDPHWLTAINAIQLAVALFANMALLLNMTRRLSFTIAQPVTIVGWYISSLALVALTATAAGPLVAEPADEFIWSQAFYYAIYSAVLYFFVASLMVVTYLGAQAGHYPKDFMLTPSQRTLMLQTIMLLLYLLLGALLFSKLEDWSYLDGVYWAAVTLFTVGFGDLHATTTLGRALLLPYSLVGIISLGLVIGSIRSLVLDRGKRRLGARMVEKKRRRTLQRMTKKGKDDILVPIKEGPPLSSVPTNSSGLTEFERREHEFKLMRKIQEAAAHRRRWVAMGISTGTWLVLWMVGAKIFQECEDRYQGWTYFDGLYFAYVSLTTIGYGDVTPVSNAGKSFWVFWGLLALPTMTVLISNAGDTIVKGIRDATDQIATVTILPSEAGFKKDFKRLLRTISCGVLFDEDIEEEPTGMLGYPQHLKPSATQGTTANDNDDPEEAMHQDEAELEAEGAASESTRQKRAARRQDEEGHAAQAETNAALEESDTKRQPTPSPSSSNTTKVTFSTPIHHLSSQQQHPRHRLHHSPSIPRHHLPLPISKDDYHIILIDEIRRVTQHLKHHPPRKYTFHEWAWYLHLLGEDEADAERHRKANPYVKERRDKLIAGGSTSASNGAKTQASGQKKGNGAQGPAGGDKDGVGGDGEKKEEEVVPPWSWVGSRSPLMGSKEEAEWILERLIARLAEELRMERDKRHKREQGHIAGEHTFP